MKFTKNKKYDLFIGDLLTIVGLIRKVPTIFATDDTLKAVPQGALFYKTATHIVAPFITDLGPYNKKKIGYYGYKAIAHLHPNHFAIVEQNKVDLHLLMMLQILLQIH